MKNIISNPYITPRESGPSARDVFVTSLNPPSPPPHRHPGEGGEVGKRQGKEKEKTRTISDKVNSQNENSQNQ